jgi:carboxyl-terminal processing protease
MKKNKKNGLIITITLAGIFSGCFISPTEPEKKSDYEFAASVLDAYFIFQNQLPVDLYAYPSPESLYASVNEPWTEYYNKEKAAILRKMLSTVTAGIGIRLDSARNGFVIIDVFVNTPAQKAGLLKKDTIVSVNTTSCVGVDFSTLHDLLQGEQGTSVTLGIRRGSQLLEITITRDVFLAPSVFTDSLDSVTVSIRINSFFTKTSTVGGTEVEFRNALESSKWAKNLIIDIRGNGGGEINQCVAVAGYLVPAETPMVYFHERFYDELRNVVYTRDTLYKTTGTGYYSNRNLYVLVDKNTASASEMLVLCLKQKTGTGIVKLIGTKTYGKGRGQIVAVGPDSVMAKVTYATILPVSAPVYDLVGIEPDISVQTGDARDVALGIIHSGRANKRFSRLSTGNDFSIQSTEPMAIKIQE